MKSASPERSPLGDSDLLCDVSSRLNDYPGPDISLLVNSPEKKKAAGLFARLKENLIPFFTFKKFIFVIFKSIFELNVRPKGNKIVLLRQGYISTLENGKDCSPDKITSLSRKGMFSYSACNLFHIMNPGLF